MLLIALALALQPAPQTTPAATAPTVQSAPQPIDPPDRPGLLPPRPAPELPPEPAPPLSDLTSDPGLPRPPILAYGAVPAPMRVEISRDLITDHLSAFAVAPGSHGRLEIGCDHRRFEGIRVRFSGRTWLARGNVFTGHRPMVHRFDDAPPRRSFWVVRARRATLVRASQTASFLRSVLSSQRLVIRVFDVEGREVDLIFPLIATPPAIDQMLRACGADALHAELFGAR